MAEVNMHSLLRAGAHFGHQTRYWHPKMAPFVYGARNKIHIIDLDHTVPALQRAVAWVSERAALGERILFVGSKRAASEIMQRAAERAGMPYVCHRWLGGTLTNYKTIHFSVKRLLELEIQRDNGEFAKLTKKEAMLKQRELEKRQRAFGGIKDMPGLPDALFVIDIQHEHIAVAEAKRLGLNIVAVVDTNCDPSDIDFVIPGNDDSRRAIVLYADAIADACVAGKARMGQYAPDS